MGGKLGCGIAAMAVALLATAGPALADYGPSTPPSPGPQTQVLPEVQTAPQVAPQVQTAPQVTPAVPQVLGQQFATPQPAVSGTTLPFTGGDIAGLTVIGLGLLGVGLAVRRAGRRRAAD